MNMKLISVGVAALFALTALPTTSAAPTNDGLTRTFDATVFVEVEFKDRGLGIYNAGSPQAVCPVALLGLRAVVSDAFYYQSGRLDVNLKAGVIPVTSPIGMGPGIGPCPIPGTTPDPQFVWVPDFNIWLPYTAVTVDQLICGQQNFLSCFPDPSTASLDISNCGLPVFENQRPDDNKGILGGTGTAELLKSRSVISGCGDAIVYLNATTSTDCDITFGEGGWGTGFCLVQNHDHVPYGTGSAYIVSCTSTEYDWFDFTAIPPTNGNAFAESHDYKLILDLFSPGDWPAALTHHIGSTGQVNHIALQGWSDLGGSNGCPSTTSSTAFDRDAKKKGGSAGPDLCDPGFDDCKRYALGTNVNPIANIGGGLASCATRTGGVCHNSEAGAGDTVTVRVKDDSGSTMRFAVCVDGSGDSQCPMNPLAPGALTPGDYLQLSDCLTDGNTLSFIVPPGTGTGRVFVYVMTDLGPGCGVPITGTSMTSVVQPPPAPPFPISVH